MDKLKRFQKELRASQTDAENLLWYRLRNRNLFKYKFRRQHTLQAYIVDFVCLEKSLIIELDGGQHAEQQTYDEKRTQQLKKEGFQVLRFWNNEVLNNIEGVLFVVQEALVNQK